jgi:SagB-type dehydrogenase family enzyme
MTPSPHRDFHAASSLDPGVERHKPAAEVTAADREARTDPGKRYGTGRYDLALPASSARAEISLDAALAARRSGRGFSPAPVAFEQVGAVLSTYRPSGELEVPGGPLTLRTAASAGALYPIEVYLVARRVSDLPAGVYHYRPEEMAITAIRRDAGAVANALESLVLDPPQAQEAAGALMLTARFERSTHKYGERGYRYLLIEAGEVVQTLALGAAATGTGLVCHGAFYDGPANRLLGLDGLSESVLAILLFGGLAENSKSGDQAAQPAPRR